MAEKEEILSQIVTALQEGLGERLMAVVLYGSRARSQAREGSDWDLFIIATDLPVNLWERHVLLKRFLPAAYRGAVSLLVKTPEEFEEKISSNIWILPRMVKFSLTPKDMPTGVWLIYSA